MTGARPAARPGIERLGGNPIVRPEMLPNGDGDNINGPSLIRVPDWLPDPLGAYHLYFAHHHGSYIRLAYADDLRGPWRVHAPGTLHLVDAPGCFDHIASPDVHVDHDRREIRMYFHGPVRDRSSGPAQQTFVATSTDGIHFTARDEPLGNAYWRAFRWQGDWYAMARWGVLYRSRDGLSDFAVGPSPFPGLDVRTKVRKQLRRAAARAHLTHGPPNPHNAAPSRHVAVHRVDDSLWVYYSNIGDAPERIVRSRLSLTPDWTTWKVDRPVEVVRPEAAWEGADLPVRRSYDGIAPGPERALRDPYVFADDGTVHLLYAVAGEQGIAIARLHP